ncbi:hypothetical protein GPECTOR_9g611 [Gonium pectorale]|uniref:Major facilitator superfamily (MFS) profile domain-containing protein n=1 Tax=Gonium pectorale TaxID=33097 RepID=A0A150GRX2_GONPE|nr:hypothetical protein GPECTOR_9g611 [Gonium pectorale]|eukprot:KXZ52567.1 hypothetical protein GPECTOR_9g611 [Gonium pectorale]
MLHNLISESLKASDGLFVALWETRVWRLLVFLLIYSLGLAIFYPFTPTIITNGFASLAAGRAMDCTLYTPATSPPECVDAHSTAVTYSSWTNFVSSSLLTFVCAPYAGHLSDRIGRKPFMLAGISLTFLPLAIIQLHLHDVLPIYWYYPASAAGGLVSSFTMTLTSVADLMEQRHRATAVGYLTSCFSVGMLVGPTVGGYLSVKGALWTCLALTALTLLYVAAFVPECAPLPLARRAAAAAATGAAAPLAAGKAHAGAAGKAHAGAAAGEDCLAPAGAAATAEAALAEAEEVSMMSGQQHLMLGGTMPALAAHATATAAAADGAVATAAAAAADGYSGRDLEFGQASRRHAAATCSSSSEGGTHGSAEGSCGPTHGFEPASGRAPGPLGGLGSGWSVVWRSPYYRRIALIWIVVSADWEGAGELLMQYLQLTLGFNTRDTAHVLMVISSGGLVVKLGLLALLVRWMGERRLLAFGLAAYAAECLALAGAGSKAAGLAAVSIGGLASVCWPCLTALQTAGVDPRQQGAVFGALQGISAMASGLGPLLFASVFRAVTRTDSPLPFMPWVVWLLAAALTAVAIGITLTLPQPRGAAAGAGGGAAAAAPGGAKPGAGASGGGADPRGGSGKEHSAEAGAESASQLREPLLPK